jgi:hypothetical protein
MAYFCQQQIKKHVVQFMEIFRGTEVKTGINKSGEIETIEVPIMYGSMDRSVAAILANNTQNVPLRLPVMSAVMTGMALAQDRFKGIDTEKTTAYTPLGGVFPHDTVTVSQITSVPFTMSMELHIFSNNTDTRWQILEQILVLFNPSIQIQTSDSKFDGSKITKVDLTGITSGENMPLGADRRIIVDTLTFELIIYLVAPSQIRDDRIKDIKIRVAKVSDVSLITEIPDSELQITEINVMETLV